MRFDLVALLVVAMLALAACGTKPVDTTAYTCGQFQKSLRTNGDNTAGSFINQLRKKAKLDQPTKTERTEITVGIVVSCRGKPASTRPAARAITIAKQIKAGTYKSSGRKKSTK